MGAGRGTAARLAAGEGGLTVVEVAVAGMILVVGGLGVLGMVDASTRNAYRAEQSQSVNNVLQREMERIRELPYEGVGLNTLPSHESGDNNPASRVSATAFYTNRAGTGLKPLVLEGSVSPGPEPFEVEDVTGTVYRYVVWDACPESYCADGDYLKRAIVAVKLDATAPGGGDRRYQEIQAQIVDPEAEPAENPGPAPGGGTITPWTLWLTDTTCDQSKPRNAKEKEEAEGEGIEANDHLAHNTRGTCSDGQQAGNEPGAPDLLWPAAPDASEENPVFDYATDVEPEAEPDKDKGLQVLVGDKCGEMPVTEVASEPDADATMFQQLHKWITPPINTSDLALTGEVTVNLWTQSIEHGVYPATICLWLFVREGAEDTPLTHVFESLPYVTYSQSPWPSTGWKEVIVSSELATPEGEIPLASGSRVGLALSVEASSESGIQTLYDEPTFDSLVRLGTTGELPEWP